MGAVDAVVRAGKVRQVAASNFSADRLTSAPEISARDGLAPLVAVQPQLRALQAAAAAWPGPGWCRRRSRTSRAPPICSTRSRIDVQPDPRLATWPAAAAGVGDRDRQRRRRRGPARTTGGGHPGVPGDVRDRLHRDPVGDHLDRRRQGRQLVAGASISTLIARPSAARSRETRWRRAPTSPSSSSARGRSPCTIRRISAMASAASARSATSTAAAASAPGGEQVTGGVGAVGDPGQGRAQTVVQVAADPAALLLQRGHHPAAGDLQLGGQPGRVHRLRQRRATRPRHGPGRGWQPELVGRAA